MSTILLATADLSRAVARAAENKPLVRASLPGRFFVLRSDQILWATVLFFIDRLGRRCGSCDCPAGRAGRVCYHLAAALPLHCACAAARAAAAPVPVSVFAAPDDRAWVAPSDLSPDVAARAGLPAPPSLAGVLQKPQHQTQSIGRIPI